MFGASHASVFAQFPACDSVAVFPESPGDADADSTSSAHRPDRTRRATGNWPCHPAPEVYGPCCAGSVAHCFRALPPPPVAPCRVGPVSRIWVRTYSRPRRNSARAQALRCPCRQAGSFITYPKRSGSPAAKPGRILALPSPRPGFSSRYTARFIPVTVSSSILAKPVIRSPFVGLDSSSTVPNALKST